MSRDELIELARRQNIQISSMASRLSELLEVNEALEGEHAKQIAELTAMNNDLAARLAKVEHLLSRNSSNSSMPPSKDDDVGKTPQPAKPKRRGIRSVSGVSSRGRRARTWRGPRTRTGRWTGFLRGAASVATTWPVPPISVWSTAISSTRSRRCR